MTGKTAASSKIGAAIAAFAGAAALGGVSARASDLVSNPRGMVAYFDAASVGAILSEMGFVWQERHAPTGQPYLAVSANGAIAFMVIPTACQAANFTNCVGLNTVSILAGKKFNHQTVTAFNQRYWFSTAGMTPDGDNAYVSRYEISDYGIPRGNIAASILNLLELSDRLRAELSTAGRTVSLEGYASDLAARSLNARALKAVAGEEAVPSMTRHQAALEENAALINVLINDADAPRNKVENLTGK
ncbi:MAG: YbjN domain-containing protein [Amphiplicatus sp.]